MKNLYLALVLLLIPFFSFAQSTNKAQLKSALLSETMKTLDIDPEIIEVYEKIAEDLKRELGEEISFENLRVLTVEVYGVTDYDESGNPNKGGLIDKRILDIVSSDNTRNIIVDTDKIYIRMPDKVTIKSIDGAILSENFLDFDEWDAIIAAANKQLGLSLDWKVGYTLGGTPEIYTDDGRYLVMFFSDEAGWVVFMPGNEAKKLEL
jgi:hypothetical protein